MATDEDVGDVHAMWKDYKKDRAEKRASNREKGTQLLAEAGFSYESLNGGAHLRVEGVNYWPGTGLWRDNANGRSSRGVFKLIKYLKGKTCQHQPRNSTSS